jgi:VanZ family protein
MLERAKRYGNKKVLYLLPVLWMGVIFYFSHQNGDESSQVSGWFVDFVIRVAEILNLDITGWNLNLLVRKAAHFSIFAVLGFLLFLTLYINRQKLFSSSVYAFAIGSIYGVFDEFHQYFVPGRSCQLTDMLIDASGVMAAVLISIGVMQLKR